MTWARLALVAAGAYSLGANAWRGAACALAVLAVLELGSWSQRVGDRRRRARWDAEQIRLERQFRA